LKKSYYVIQKKGDEIYVYYLKDWKANERLLGGATQHISEKIAEKVASGGKKVSEKLDDAQNYIKKGTDWLFERAGDNTNIIYNQSNRWKISRKFWAKEGGVSEFAKDNMMGRAFTGTKGSVIVQATNPARFMTGVLQAGTGTALYTVGLAGSLARGYLYTIAEQQLIRVGAKPGFVIMEGVLEKPYENAKDFVINVRMRNLHKDRYTYVPAWQPEFNNVVNIMSGGTKEEKEKRLSAYMNEQGLTGKTEKETKETLHGWAQTLPAGLKK